MKTWNRRYGKTAGTYRLGLVVALSVAFLGSSPESRAAKRSPNLQYAAERGMQVEPPADDAALLVLVRPSRSWKKAESPVYLDGEFLTLLTGETGFQQVSSPGEHILEARGETPLSLEVKLEPGRVHYVRVEPEMGRWKPSFRPEPLDPDDKKEPISDLLAGLYEVTPTEGAAVAMAEKDGKKKEEEAAAAAEKPKTDARSLQIPTSKTTDLVAVASATGVVLSAAPTDQAIVLFLRESGSWGSAQSPIFEGRELLGFLVGESAFEYRADPGEHLFMVVGENADFLSASLQAGRTYFVLVTPQLGKWNPEFRLEPLTPDSADWEKLPKWLAKMNTVEPSEESAAWVDESLESLLARGDDYLPRWIASPEEERAALHRKDGVTELPSSP